MNKHIELQGILLDAGQRFLQGSILLGSPDKRTQWGDDQAEWRLQLMRHIDEELIFLSQQLHRPIFFMLFHDGLVTSLIPNDGKDDYTNSNQHIYQDGNGAGIPRTRHYNIISTNLGMFVNCRIG